MRSRSENISMIIVLVVMLLAAAWYFRSSVLGSTSATQTTSTASSSPSPTGSTSASASPAGSPSAGASPNVIAGGSTVVFLGDSFAAGAGASSTDKRWTSLLSATQSWTEVNQAHSQTGYVVAGSSGDCSPQTCPGFPAAAATLADSGAALVILSGGANDLAQTPADVGAGVTATLAAIRTALPAARIVVLDPWWDMRPADERLAAVTTAVKDAATAGGATWVDLGQPIAGKSSDFKTDGFSANDAGHQALAEAVKAGLVQAGFIAS